jgi:hypothetical protein
VDIDAYARVHAEFPNETTADQFFDEDQLEAYRELGIETAEQALDVLRNRKKSEQKVVDLSEYSQALGLGAVQGA